MLSCLSGHLRLPENHEITISESAPQKNNSICSCQSTVSNMERGVKIVPLALLGTSCELKKFYFASQNHPLDPRACLVASSTHIKYLLRKLLDFKKITFMPMMRTSCLWIRLFSSSIPNRDDKGLAELYDSRFQLFTSTKWSACQTFF